MDLTTVGERVRRLRERQKLSGSDLAEMAGVHPNTIRNMEAGKSVTLGTVFHVAEALGIEVASLFRRNGKRRK